jgi:hypothetical protein
MIAAFIAIASPAWGATLANTEQEKDYLRSLSNGVGGHGGAPTNEHVLPYVVLAIAAIVLLVWWNLRQERPKKIKPVNHSRKLLRQISRQVGLASDEVRQLKVLADVHERDSGQRLDNPLTLLLCPSILTRTLQTRDVKIDRQVVARLARRISQTAPKA